MKNKQRCLLVGVSLKHKRMVQKALEKCEDFLHCTVFKVGTIIEYANTYYYDVIIISWDYGKAEKGTGLEILRQIASSNLQAKRIVLVNSLEEEVKARQSYLSFNTSFCLAKDKETFGKLLQTNE